MFWKTGLLLAALAFSQVLAELASPVFIEDALKGQQKVVGTGVSSRIVSGWEAQLGQHPHQVSLRMIDPFGGVGGCGGSVVHKNWVITAAHCTAGRVTVVVRAGLIDLSRPQYIDETNEWWNHPTYDENRPLVVQPNEICILKLRTPVTYTDILKPIRIQNTAEASKNYDQEILVASGWGRIWTDGAQPEILQWVYLRGVSNQACQTLYGTALINNAAICAQWFNVTSQSTCQGDSGGPLVHYEADGSPVLVGISSFVAGGQYGCHSGLPAGFVRPGPFLSWFEEITGIDFENLEEEQVTEAPTEPPTTLAPTTTTTEAPTTQPAPTPDPDSEEEEEDSDEDSDEDDEQVSELLKKLVVKVKVKVNINNKLKKKVKVKCVDKV